MTWDQTKLGYYLDFILVPLVMVLAFGLAIFHGASLLPVAAAMVGGFALWTYLEYWIHRTLFHHVFRRQHWMHHKSPDGYIAAPPQLTAALHVSVWFLAVIHLGWTLGSGIFLGLEAGYLAYILVHDAIHHRYEKGRWLTMRAELHDHHHDGKEKNFGVVSSVVDRLHGTYESSAQKT